MFCCIYLLYNCVDCLLCLILLYFLYFFCVFLCVLGMLWFLSSFMCVYCCIFWEFWVVYIIIVIWNVKWSSLWLNCVWVIILNLGGRRWVMIWVVSKEINDNWFEFIFFIVCCFDLWCDRYMLLIGECRIRVYIMVIFVVKDFLELYKVVDVDVIIFLMSRFGECICFFLSYCLKLI